MDALRFRRTRKVSRNRRSACGPKAWTCVKGACASPIRCRTWTAISTLHCGGRGERLRARADTRSAIRSAAVQVPLLQRSCAPTFRKGTCTASLRIARDLVCRDPNVLGWGWYDLTGLGEPPGLRGGGNSPVEGSALLIPKTLPVHGIRIAAHPWAAPALPSRSRAA